MFDVCAEQSAMQRMRGNEIILLAFEQGMRKEDRLQSPRKEKCVHPPIHR